MGPSAGLDGTGKSHPPIGIRSPDLPARTKSLYRLSYPGPPKSYRLIIVRCLRSLVFTNFRLLVLASHLHYDPRVDSASNRNEYQKYFLEVKAAGAYG
jgi:hypothetical protein